MTSNLEKYNADLKALISRGERLYFAMVHKFLPDKFEKQWKAACGNEGFNKFVSDLPDVNRGYQSWYSEAKSLIRQLLPERFDDFVRHYERPKSRKELTYETYVIEDGLRGLTARNGFSEKIVGPDATIQHFEQQLNILRSLEQRFQSSLFDIKQLVQAELFDSELEAAAELHRKGFRRAAGAVAGVVLERHLAQVCENHGIKATKRDPGISDLNDLLKAQGVIETPQWRSIQFLADLRNLCDHDKKKEPTSDEVSDLLAGVGKVTKTLY
jgi:hypothetical protein